jgi:hypothetical protein
VPLHSIGRLIVMHDHFNAFVSILVRTDIARTHNCRRTCTGTHHCAHPHSDALTRARASRRFPGIHGKHAIAQVWMKLLKFFTVFRTFGILLIALEKMLADFFRCGVPTS